MNDACTHTHTHMHTYTCTHTQAGREFSGSQAGLLVVLGHLHPLAHIHPCLLQGLQSGPCPGHMDLYLPHLLLQLLNALLGLCVRLVRAKVRVLGGAIGRMGGGEGVGRKFEYNEFFGRVMKER